MAVTVEALLDEARRRLAAAEFAPPTREAALLLGRVLALSEAQVRSRSLDEVPEAAARRFTALLGRRLRGEPVAYLLGEKEFYGRPFTVDPRVLIPRPETEHLVETALELAPSEAPRLLDLGTGSGCLAVTLALELPRGRVVAADVSPGALAVAAANARRHGVGDRLAVVGSDLASALAISHFDLVVSNPPYIAPSEAATLSPEVRDFEPYRALFTPGPAGAVVGRLIAELGALRPGTPLLLEIGQGLDAEIPGLLAGSAFDLVEIRPDYAGIPRVVVLRRQ